MLKIFRQTRHSRSTFSVQTLRVARILWQCEHQPLHMLLNIPQTVSLVCFSIFFSSIYLLENFILPLVWPFFSYIHWNWIWMLFLVCVLFLTGPHSLKDMYDLMLSPMFGALLAAAISMLILCGTVVCFVRHRVCTSRQTITSKGSWFTSFKCSSLKKNFIFNFFSFLFVVVFSNKFFSSFCFIFLWKK